MGLASVILGVIGLVLWIIPFFGFPVCVSGLILGIPAMKPGATKRRMAIAGVAMCGVGLVLTIVNIFTGLSQSLVTF
jgi:hypothetical protein